MIALSWYQSSVVAELYVEAFEKKALELASLKPRLYKRFVADTFLVWPHGTEKLTDFVTLLNRLHQNIQFTVELEVDGTLLFLDILLKRNSNGTLGCTVLSKSTHTNHYIDSMSHYHRLKNVLLIHTVF